jgi:hypothetical protein
MFGVDTVRQALTLLQTEQVLTLVPVAGTRFRALVTEVAGGPVKGSLGPRAASSPI